MGPLVVTGASGGVGMLALDMPSAAPASEVHAVKAARPSAPTSCALDRRQRSAASREALHCHPPAGARARIGGGLDNVGGPMLVSLLAQTVPYGNVASAGLAAFASAGHDGHAFILRGVFLLGIGSSGSARDIREQVGPPGRRLAATAT